MKKIITLLVTFLLAAGFASKALASPANKAVFQLGSDRYTVNSQEKSMGAIAFMNKDRVFVPVRYLAYACGLKDEDIKWDGPTRTVTLKSAGKSLTLQVGSSRLVSGYRSTAEQKSIFDERVGLYSRKEAASTVALPGCSEHQTGLAVDIGGDTEAVYSWLAANSWRYGFILRYPEGKEKITGYSYEPWHFRYLGVPAATFMRENNISTMEEFAQAVMAGSLLRPVLQR